MAETRQNREGTDRKGDRKADEKSDRRAIVREEGHGRSKGGRDLNYWEG